MPSMSARANAAKVAIEKAKAQAAGKVGSYVDRGKGQGPAKGPKDTPRGIAQGALKGFEGAAPGNFQSGGFQRADGKTSRTPEELRYIMRDQYGFKMQNATFEQLEEQRRQMESAINQFRSQANERIGAASGRLNEARAQFQSQVGSAESQFKSAQAQLAEQQKRLGNAPTSTVLFENWYKSQPRVPIYVRNGEQIEGTYYAPKAVVDSFNSDRQGWDAKYANGGYVIEVRQSGRIRGAEAHSLARELSNRDRMYNEFIKTDAFKQAQSQASSQWQQAQSQLSGAAGSLSSQYSQFQGQKSAAQQQLEAAQAEIQRAEAERDHQIALVVQRRQAQIDALRKEYEALSARKELAYANLAKGGGYTPGGGDETAERKQ